MSYQINWMTLSISKLLFLNPYFNRISIDRNGQSQVIMISSILNLRLNNYKSWVCTSVPYAQYDGVGVCPKMPCIPSLDWRELGLDDKALKSKRIGHHIFPHSASPARGGGAFRHYLVGTGVKCTPH